MLRVSAWSMRAVPHALLTEQRLPHCSAANTVQADLAQQMQDKASRAPGRLDGGEQALVVSGKPDPAAVRQQKLRQQAEYRCAELAESARARCTRSLYMRQPTLQCRCAVRGHDASGFCCCSVLLPGAGHSWTHSWHLPRAGGSSATSRRTCSSGSSTSSWCRRRSGQRATPARMCS